MEEVLKRGCIFLFMLLALSSFVCAQPGLPDIEGGVEEAKSAYEIRTSYLQEQWEELLLKNPVVVGIDSFLSEIKVVFWYLFREDYQLTSLAFWLIIVLWVLFAIWVANMTDAILTISYRVSLLIGVLAAIFFAHLRVFSLVVRFVLKVIFSPESGWTRLIVAILAVFLVMFLFKFGNEISEYIKRTKQGFKEERAKHLLTLTKKFLRAVGV